MERFKTDPAEEKRTLIIALFLSGNPLSIDYLKKIIEGDDFLEKIENYVSQFNSEKIGLYIRKVAEGYQMIADLSYAPKLSYYYDEKNEKLSKSSLDTLSIIAYKQPITKSEIESYRGVDCSNSIRKLLEKGLISVSGRKNVLGRPLIYITSQYFLEYFGINSLTDLPTFREWEELNSR